jgi:hypothetical protein
MKPGYQTTEMWGSYAGAAACFQVATEIPTVVTDPIAQTITVSAAIIGAVALIIWYTIKRTDLKKSQ